MIIYIISDEKKGHLSQTRGLASALLERAVQKAPNAPHAVHEISVVGKTWFSKFLYKGKDLDLPRPDLILCAGHSTHLAAISLSRHLRCPRIVCMKPSLPARMFDLCIIPRHDIPEGKTPADNVFLTNGAINNIKPQPQVTKTDTLILIGGPSKEFDWDAEHVLNQLTTIVRHCSNNIVLTTSRRTPKDFVQDVTAACPSVRVEPVEQTGPTWVADHLACAREVWVTQDSVSMVYESLSSGAPVGVIEMPRKRSKKKKDTVSRVARGLNMLTAEGEVCTFTAWAKEHKIPQSGNVLDEAGRTADYILQKFPKLLH
ncbi:MAG: mitochondrial fission ELM1 family protein [Akkermansia sp.]|nr:mitochondrial fission ELM1 family protein [Akkermansia sp.]